MGHSSVYGLIRGRVDCIPATVDAVDIYEVSYVKSLQQRVAELEARFESQNPEVTPTFIVEGEQQQSSYFIGDDLQPMDPMHWQCSFYPPTNQPPRPRDVFEQPFLDSSGIDLLAAHNSADVIGPLEDSIPPHDQDCFGLDPAIQTLHKNVQTLQQLSISNLDAARFLHTYFDLIHPRYPFLDVDECGNAYLYYKGMLVVTDEMQVSWYSFLLTLLCAIGSTISHSTNSSRLSKQHGLLLARVQDERGVISNHHASPLVRLKAMLLHVILALHGENTSRLVHLSGVTMRFATLHGFHRLTASEPSEENNAKTKAWSCIYALDRMISGTLRIPVCIAESFITSPCYLDCSPYLCSMPWLSDYPSHGSVDQVLLEKTFTHMLRIRTIQSKVMCTAPTLTLDEAELFIANMEEEINEWSDHSQIFTHIDPENVGYLSSFWLQYMACVGRVVLYSSFGEKDYEMPRAARLLKACCDTCTAFRTVQKGKQLVRSWIDMVFDFQAGITILYLKWRGSDLGLRQDIDRGIRSCTSTLAILAEGAPNVEVFRDCFDALATFVGRSDSDDDLSGDASEDLRIYCRKVIALGVAPYIATMLLEMSNAA
ncbi:uncharacterized protein A1O9_09738 [Exophiala aquamarina CBS 119918]|uniref:Xylanolytic transcriptional activator regulatory domain-containing protein n=1 Tax=Exophiala aquamarina CBS 119918 TaxID=1182545 RepID=A0A072P3T1_9EURO|nr:uncharacterized protein A1O9_09738 [Exophiala aquamarina CBS 119918]KEF53943.1 hypothetical protein A1O9_09738 [Exophiala aquamarina CBS 119918]